MERLIKPKQIMFACPIQCYILKNVFIIHKKVLNRYFYRCELQTFLAQLVSFSLDHWSQPDSHLSFANPHEYNDSIIFAEIRKTIHYQFVSLFIHEFLRSDDLSKCDMKNKKIDRTQHLNQRKCLLKMNHIVQVIACVLHHFCFLHHTKQ